MNCRLGIAVGMLCVVALPATAQSANTGTTGSGAAHQNIQPSLGANYIIALQGIFPSHSGGGSSADPFVGEISLFSGNFAPRGWAFANGQELPINQNTALFSLLENNYGGNGTTTFALPDLRGRVPIGFGQGPGLTNRPLGQKVGTESVALTADQLPSHIHVMPTGEATGITGGGLPHAEMQPSLALNYMIALQGIFPPHPNGGSGSGLDPFVGEVALVASNFAPTGYAFADGRLLNINQNTALFSVLGTTYGGDGLTTFALPDLRGRAAIGAGQGPGMSEQELGRNVGAETVSLTKEQLPPHSHSLSGGGNTGSTGSNEAHSNMQPSLGLNYIVSLYGVYPSTTVSGSGGPFVGEIRLFAGNYAPDGWRFADGSLIDIAENEVLFNVIGTTYGGDGETNFALPDLRGRLAIGMGQGAGLSNRLLANAYGEEGVALSVAQLPAHSHKLILPGDYTDDGKVDAADYVAWRHRLGPVYSETQFTSWKAKFGGPGGGGADGSPGSAAPEPGTFALFLVAASALVANYRARAR